MLFPLDPAVAYLNHGMVGVVPIAVLRAQQRLRDEMETNPARFFTRGLRDRIEHARRHVATAVGADPEDSALVVNTSTGISTVLASIPLRPGDEILTTDHGHEPVQLAAQRAATTSGAELVVAPVALDASDEETVAAVLSRVRPGRTRLVIIDMITSSTARLFPVARLATELRRTDAAVLVDAAHAPGALPLDVGAIRADFFVGNLHKWAFSPRSAALLSVAPRWRASMRPLVTSWAEPEGFPLSVEYAGTRDPTAWLAAPTGLFVLRTLGEARVRAHNAQLARYGQHVIGSALGLDPDRLPDPGGPVPMRVVPLPVPPGTDPIALRDRIADELATAVAVHAWRGTLLLRLSAQVYNRPEEYERLADRLPALLATLR